jgi:hypothetical protein
VSLWKPERSWPPATPLGRRLRPRSARCRWRPPWPRPSPASPLFTWQRRPSSALSGGGTSLRSTLLTGLHLLPRLSYVHIFYIYLHTFLLYHTDGLAPERGPGGRVSVLDEGEGRPEGVRHLELVRTSGTPV